MWEHYASKNNGIGHALLCYFSGVGLQCIGPFPLVIKAETKLPLFADDIFRFIFFYANGGILSQLSLKYVDNGPVYNMPPLYLIMAPWRSLTFMSYWSLHFDLYI